MAVQSEAPSLSKERGMVEMAGTSPAFAGIKIKVSTFIVQLIS